MLWIQFIIVSRQLGRRGLDCDVPGRDDSVVSVELIVTGN
jgi:hypothetical protein